MKLRAFSLGILLSILLGIAACGEGPGPANTVVATSFKQTAPPADDTVTGRILRLMQFYEDSEQFSGTILVAQDGKIVYEDAFGWANLEWRIPNTIDTKYRIASITKQFTAVLVMQQVEMGRLRLDGTVSDYLPDYPERNGARINIHHLLSHTAGIVSFEDLIYYLSLGGTARVGDFTFQVTDDERVPDYFSIGRLSHTRKDLLGHFADKDLLFSPGSQSRYSQFGFTLLAVILEQVTGQSYQQILQEGILDPAGMKNTGIDDNSSILERRASGYLLKPLVGPENTFVDMSLFLGGGDLYSTVEDLYLFDEALHTGQLLSDDSLDRMIRSGWLGGPIEFPYENGPLDALGGSGAISIGGFNSNVRRLTGGRGVQFIAILSNYNNPEGVQLGPVYSETVARQIAAIINGLEHESPTLSAASVVGRAVLESGGDVASTTMADLVENASSMHRFEVDEFLFVANHLAGLGKHDEACQFLKSCVGHLPETPEVRQKLTEYCQ
jgi:CubicO group peptidase (beta-lactamase class C family)